MNAIFQTCKLVDDCRLRVEFMRWARDRGCIPWDNDCGLADTRSKSIRRTTHAGELPRALISHLSVYVMHANNGRLACVTVYAGLATMQ